MSEIGPSEPHRAPEQTHAESRKAKLKNLGPILGGLAGLGYLLFKLKALKFLLPAIKFLKLGKIFTTAGTMLVSMWAYATYWGWPFAAGFVLLILVHEMGHVFVAWRQGLPVSAPVFIPFMGALILQREAQKSAWGQAIMGIGGPVAGTIGALLCYGLYLATGSGFFLGLAYVGFFLNLFNLFPVLPLDGGWIVGSISPWLWLFGLVGVIAAFVTGWLRNPFVFVLVLLSLPYLWQGLRRGGAPPGGVPATQPQRWTMGLCYLSLCAFLAWAMAAAHEAGPYSKRDAETVKVEARSGDPNSPAREP